MRESSQYLVALVAGTTVALGGVAVAAALPGLQAPVTLAVAADDAADVEMGAFTEQVDTSSDGVIDPDAPDPDAPDPDAVDPDAPDPDDGDDASAFADWVASIPSDWGCVRGRVISAHAADPKEGFEGPRFTDIDEAIEALDLDGRCVEVARARAAGADAGPAADRPEGAGPPEHAGRPEGAGPPEHAGRPEGAGPPEHAGRPEVAGASEGRGGPPEHAGRPEGAGPPEHAGRPDGAGPPEGRGGR